MAENIPPSPESNSIPQPQQPKQVKPFFRRIAGQKPKKGDLIGFRYTFWKHDPHPLVLVTGLYDDGRIAGVNLHNLTLGDMKNLVSQYCNKANISYQNSVKGKRNIVKGFRTYKWEGMKDVIILDCENFLGRLGVVREKKLLSPNEVAKLRIQIQQQLRRQINPRADDLNKIAQNKPATLGSVPGKPASIPGIPIGEQPGGK